MDAVILPNAGDRADLRGTSGIGENLVVTGASRGIGAAVAQLAARHGYRVCINYRNDREAADHVVREIVEAGGTAVAVKGDISRKEDVRSLFDAAEVELGPVDALVNNAGVTGPIGPFVDAGIETLQRVLDVNTLGTMLCTQEAVIRLSRRKAAGAIVNISSIAATTGAANEYVHYAASKAAIDAFTVGLAKEVAGLNIRVNAVAAGTTLTGIHAAAGDPDRPERVRPKISMQRLAHPAEIAEAVLWLLSPRSSYVTGTVLKVAGGL